MRTNIDIDDKVMAAAMKTGEFRTKKEAVEAGLRLIVRQQTYQRILALKGKLQWDDALDFPPTAPKRKTAQRAASMPRASAKNAVRARAKR